MLFDMCFSIKVFIFSMYNSMENIINYYYIIIRGRSIVIHELMGVHDYLLVYFKLSRFVVVLNPIDKSQQHRQRQDKNLIFKKKKFK